MVLPTLNYPILKYSRILLSHKKEIFTLCNSMDGPGEHYANLWELLRNFLNFGQTSSDKPFLNPYLWLVE